METKPFWRTSEFYALVLSQVGALAAALAGALPPKYAGIVSAVSAAAYMISRGLAKNGVKPQ